MTKHKTEREQRLQAMNAGMGKLPPQDVDTEEAVLGTILLNPSSLITVIDLFKPDIFYKEANQIIASAILKLHIGSYKVDILTVTSELRRSGDLEMVGGAWHITSLTSRVTSSHHLEDHVRIVYQMYLLREQIRVFTEKINQCYGLADPFDTITETTRFLDELQQGTMTKSEIPVSQLAIEAIRERETHTEVKENLGVSSGSHYLDKAIGGFQPEQLIIIAGRPGMGKTAMALSIVKAIGMTMKEPVAVFSLEMSGKQLYTRLQASVSEIDSKKIRYNNLNSDELKILYDADGDLSNCPIYIDDTPALNIDRFRAKATIMKHKYGIKAILVDYLQLMKGSKGNFNREAEISEISGKLKQVAKELKIPVIALSQLSRDVEKRGGSKLPQLSDLRDSGSIEQDADVVLFLWRPSYYDITSPIEFRRYGLDILPEKLLAVVIAKQREGETFNVPLRIKLSTMQITDHPTLIDKYMVSNQTSIDVGDKPDEELPF